MFTENSPNSIQINIRIHTHKFCAKAKSNTNSTVYCVSKSSFQTLHKYINICMLFSLPAQNLYQKLIQNIFHHFDQVQLFNTVLFMFVGAIVELRKVPKSRWNIIIINEHISCKLSKLIRAHCRCKMTNGIA